MDFFAKADQVDGVKIANNYVTMYQQTLNDLTITKIQLQQHIDREKELMDMIKDQYPELYTVLQKGEEDGR